MNKSPQGSTVHILDSDSLINLKKYYPRDIAPILWETIEQKFHDGLNIVSHHEVYRELMMGDGDDEIRQWASNNQGFFLEIDPVQASIITEIQAKFPQLANHQSMGPFADPWLVAVALKGARADGGPSCCVVTEEKRKGPGSCKVPNMCDEFGVQWTNLLGLFRSLGLQWTK